MKILVAVLYVVFAALAIVVIASQAARQDCFLLSDISASHSLYPGCLFDPFTQYGRFDNPTGTISDLVFGLSVILVNVALTFRDKRVFVIQLGSLAVLAVWFAPHAAHAWRDWQFALRDVEPSFRSLVARGAGGGVLNDAVITAIAANLVMVLASKLSDNLPGRAREQA